MRIRGYRTVCCSQEDIHQRYHSYEQKYDIHKHHIDYSQDEVVIQVLSFALH